MQLAFDQTDVHSLDSAELVCEWEVFLTNVVKNKRTHILESINLIILVKECKAGQTTNDTHFTTAHALFMVDNSA